MQPTGAKKKRRKKALITCLFTLAVIVVVIAVHHFHVKWKVERYKADLRAQGEVLEWEDLLGEPTPPELNGAALFNELSSRLPQTGVLATNYLFSSRITPAIGKSMAGWATPWIGDLSLRWSNTWDEALADYEAEKDRLYEFQGIHSKPVMDFGLDYSQGYTLPLPHLTTLKETGERLCFASACELRRGNPAAAAIHVRSMLALLEGIETEPLVLSQLVRRGMMAEAVGSTWAVLQSGGLNDADLYALQRSWEEMAFLTPLEQAYQGDRCLALETIHHARASSEEFNRFVDVALLGPSAFIGGRIGQKLTEVAWRTSWSYTDEFRMLQGQQVWLDTLRQSIRDGHASDALRTHSTGLTAGGSDSVLFCPIGEGFGLMRTLFSSSIDAYRRSFMRSLVGEANAGLAAAAIALERYRMQRGEYPLALADMIPNYIIAVPIDPVDGSPLRYRRSSPEEYLLYSIGMDMVDGGGVSAGRDAEGDWVWPQQASDREVQAYWVNLARQNLKDRASDQHTRNKAQGEEIPVEERERIIQELANQWTEQYFQALTNGTGERMIQAPLIDQQP